MITLGLVKWFIDFIEAEASMTSQKKNVQTTEQELELYYFKGYISVSKFNNINKCYSIPNVSVLCYIEYILCLLAFSNKTHIVIAK